LQLYHFSVSIFFFFVSAICFQQGAGVGVVGSTAGRGCCDVEELVVEANGGCFGLRR